MYEEYPGLDELVAFHGHMCPGLALGYRAVTAALERLGVSRAGDEELVAIVENDSCSVDAFQVLAGTTFGKGNLFFRDWGKQVFILGRRDSGEAVRVSRRWEEKDERDRDERIRHLLAAPAEELFDIQGAELELPPQAQIRRSVRCARCGEPVMETRTEQADCGPVCIDCAGREEEE